jgi:hypothetical protein
MEKTDMWYQALERANTLVMEFVGTTQEEQNVRIRMYLLTSFYVMHTMRDLYGQPDEVTVLATLMQAEALAIKMLKHVKESDELQK